MCVQVQRVKSARWQRFSRVFSLAGLMFGVLQALAGSQAVAGAATGPEAASGSLPQTGELALKLANKSDRQIIRRLIDDMVEIPAGTFQMGDTQGIGDDDEQPTHTVKVSRFALSRYEVTFGQYDVYARLTGRTAPRDHGWGRGRRPVIGVTWHNAMAFVAWLREVTGLPFRLPSEAEWEYAARAGSRDTRYSFGDDPRKLCQYGNIADKLTKTGWRDKQCSDGFVTTAPVGSFKPNAFGLYDMEGNVWEWLADCWSSNYRGAPDDSSARTRSSCSKRVQRGGSWFSGVDEVRVTYRSDGRESDKSVTLGFRVARDL